MTEEYIIFIISIANLILFGATHIKCVLLNMSITIARIRSVLNLVVRKTKCGTFTKQIDFFCSYALRPKMLFM